MTMVKRIASEQCCGVLIDVQVGFLSQISKRLRPRITANTKHFVRLLDHFRIPIVVTVERPVEYKGGLPREIEEHLGASVQIFEKNFFDLCKEKKIVNHLARLKRKQVIVAGCETDVCVLQSCLGLLSLGYEVFVVEELLFSSSREAGFAMERMAAEGATFLSYKTLYYELVEAVDGSRHAARQRKAFGPLPDDLPDSAEP